MAREYLAAGKWKLGSRGPGLNFVRTSWRKAAHAVLSGFKRYRSEERATGTVNGIATRDAPLLVQLRYSGNTLK